MEYVTMTSQMSLLRLIATPGNQLGNQPGTQAVLPGY
jgi:hypothetical protein